MRGLLVAVALVGCGSTATKPPPETSIAPPTRDEVDRPPVERARERIAVAAGRSHVCFLRTDGRLRCWGANSEGQCLSPDGEFVQVVVGSSHSCALTPSGRVRCWGHSFRGAHEAKGDDVVRLVALDHSTCTLSRDGTVRCWGELPKTLGRGPGEVLAEDAENLRAYIPKRLAVLTRAGALHELPGDRVIDLPTDLDAVVGLDRCVVDRAGDLHCFDDRGRSIVSGRGFVDLIHDAWRSRTCAVDGEGGAHCWGAGLLPSDDTIEVHRRSNVVFGPTIACHTNDEGLHCEDDDKSLLRWVPGRRYVRVYTYDYFQHYGRPQLCLVRESGVADCFRMGRHRGLGGVDHPPSVPAGSSACIGACRSRWQRYPDRVVDGEQDAAVSTRCWIRNGTASCSDGDKPLSTPSGPATWVTTDGKRSCVLRPDGAIACVGPDAPAPTGSGYRTPVLTPSDRQTGAHGRLCAIDAASTLRCWPSLSWKGRLQDGMEVTAIARVPEGHLCALRGDGTALCSHLDEPLKDERPIVSIASNGVLTCGVRDDGGLRCWGDTYVPPP
jgi:hypothetical protein